MGGRAPSLLQAHLEPKADAMRHLIMLTAFLVMATTLLIMFPVGFALGYGIRAFQSR
jgi:hypothetical protein